MTLRLRRALCPRSRASVNVGRIVRRLAHQGWHARTDTRGNKWPSTFRGIIGNALERMAHRRKNGRNAWLPAHVGDQARINRRESQWVHRCWVGGGE